MKVVISACLLGVRCRYDGGDSRNQTAIKQEKRHQLIPVCPEESGGLPTPRPPAEIVGGDGNDVLDGTAKVMTDERYRCNGSIFEGCPSRFGGCSIKRRDTRNSESKKSVLWLWRHLRWHVFWNSYVW